MEIDDAPGGFMPPAILSPPPSSVASTSTGSQLPHPRGQPLKRGGPKESALIRYVDQSVLYIQRRHAKRHVASKGAEEPNRPGISDDLKVELVEGYKSFADAAKDISSLVDVIWISGTPSVQIPYLLHLAFLVNEYLSSLAPSPNAAFRLLTKLDLAFASLLQGQDVDTGEALPGSSSRRVSGTEKVRMKSIVDRARICTVEILGQGGIDDDDDATMDKTETEDEEDPDDFNMTTETDDEDSLQASAREAQGDWDMHIARVYDRTVVELGDVLGATPIGIISDD